MLRRDKYPKNINMVKMLISLGVAKDEALLLCGYSEKEYEKMYKKLLTFNKLMDINKRINNVNEEAEEEGINVNIMLEQ